MPFDRIIRWVVVGAAYLVLASIATFARAGEAAPASSAMMRCLAGAAFAADSYGTRRVRTGEMASIMCLPFAADRVRRSTRP